MTHELHPDLDDLVLYLAGSSHDAPEAAVIERVRLHLRECWECREQVAQLSADIAHLAMSVPQIAPPLAAKKRLFQAAGIPIAENQNAPLAAKTVSIPIREASVSPAFPPGRARRTNPALVWGGWVAAAILLICAISIYVANQGMHRQLQTEVAEMHRSDLSAARAQEVLEVLTSPQAQRVTLVSAHTRPEPTGHAVYLKNRGALVFTANNLAPLPAKKTYELWVIPANGSAPVPAGTFQPDARGMANVLLPGLPKGIDAKAFGVTVENSGGSTTPTLPILLAGG
ncbi:MAG: anti-sigma factor [Acidobacteriaceae bacterium]